MEKFKFRLPHLSAIVKPSNFYLKPVLYSSTDLKFDPNSESARELKRLFKQFGSDKSTVHDYYLLYSALIEMIPSGTNILEIGIGTSNPNLPSTMGINGKPGASLRAWKASNKFRIVMGADIDKECLFTEEAIETFYVDQLEERSLQELKDRISEKNINKPYLIIDDGLHTLEANVKTFSALWPLLENGGFFVIEDVFPESIIPLVFYIQKTIPLERISIWGNPNKGLDNNLVIIGK
jgi:hypothetical protein